MAKTTDKTFAARLTRWRSWIQAAFLSVWMLPGYFLNVCGPVFHCYACPLATFACPIGVIGNFAALHTFPFFAVGMLLFVGGLLGAFICGWVCPFGFFQDLLGKIPTPRVKLPAWSGYTRWVVLVAFVLVVPFFFGEKHGLFICMLCPAGALEGAAPQMVGQALAGTHVAWPNTGKIAIVVLVVTAMLFTYRPWCTLFCPLGVIYSRLNRFSAIFLRRDPKKCTHCEACHKTCKIGVKPDQRANDPRCIRCLDCTKCPAGALTVGNVLAKTSKMIDDSTETD